MHHCRCRRGRGENRTPSNKECQQVNNGLFRLHRVIFFAYIGFTVLFAVIGVLALVRGQPDAAIGLAGIVTLPVAGIHWYAARGAKLGQRYGRRTSIIIACLMVLGFPIGTIIAFYIFSQVGEKWQDSARVPLSPAEAARKARKEYEYTHDAYGRPLDE
jgi:hypothetical protein